MKGGLEPGGSSAEEFKQCQGARVYLSATQHTATLLPSLTFTSNIQRPPLTFIYSRRFDSFLAASNANLAGRECLTSLFSIPGTFAGCFLAFEIVE
jgi:hypothetical protein